MPLEAVERQVERAIREGGEPRHPHVDANCAAIWDGLLDFALRLDAHVPLAARLAHSDVLHRAEHGPAVVVAQPAELGQEQAAVCLIELDLLRVGIAEAVRPVFLLEAREVGTPGEEVDVGPLQILERLLQRMDGRSGQPCRIRAVAPLGEQLAQPGIAELI